MYSGRLHHYTSFDGLIGILESRSMWASSIRYLNDGAEFTYAVDLFADALSEAASRRPSVRRVFRMAVHSLLNYDDESGAGTSGVFVVSFSEHGDTLSQWRAYCPAGAGVSISIDAQDLENLATDQMFRFDRCVYDIEVQRHMVAQLVDSFIPSAERVAKAFDDEQFYAAVDYLTHFESIAPLLKHPSFAEEREWRVVARRPTAASLQFRAVRTLLVPYVRFSLQTSAGLLPISHVVVGPTPHPHLNASAIRAALGAAGARNVGTAPSEIPFRAW
jgi:hypothetical protein